MVGDLRPAAGSSGAIVTEYALKKGADDISDADLEAELDQLFSSTVAQANGELTDPLASTTVNGLRAYQVSFSAELDGGTLNTDLVLVFDGTQQWNLQCQYTPRDQDQILPGCEQIWETFTVSGS